MVYLAHISQDSRRQTVLKHLNGTAELCAGFAAAFGAEDQARLAGLAHDLGSIPTRSSGGCRGVQHESITRPPARRSAASWGRPTRPSPLRDITVACPTEGDRGTTTRTKHSAAG